LGYLDYIVSVGTRLHQNIVIKGSEGRSPLKLTAFSYFRDYFLNKVITEIGKIIGLKIFSPLLEVLPKSMAKLNWGAMVGLALPWIRPFLRMKSGSLFNSAGLARANAQIPNFL